MMKRNASSKYTLETLGPIVAKSVSFMSLLRELGLQPAGGNNVFIRKKVKELGIDTSHFLGARVNSGPLHKGGPARLGWESILILDRWDGRREEPFRLHRAMIDYGFKEECSECGQPPEWKGKPLRLQVDHRDGNGLNNVPENIRFLCPNCHTQTDNYGSLNLKSRR